MAGSQQSTDDFWREYEEKTGETVLARSLGQYVYGWHEFDDPKEKGFGRFAFRRSAGNSLWGLIITTTGGFRFHHFPQANWLFSVVRFGSGEEPKEKTIFIPSSDIVSVEFKKETKWYRKIFSPSPPSLFIRYRGETGEEKELLLLADLKLEDVAAALNSLPRTPPGSLGVAEDLRSKAVAKGGVSEGLSATEKMHGNTPPFPKNK